MDWGVIGAVAVAGEIGSAKSPSNSTSSHRRGCTTVAAGADGAAMALVLASIIN